MPDDQEKHTCKCHHSNPFEALYGFGLIGAAVYYLQHATSFTTGVVGVIKAVAWPAVVLYKVLELLGL